jgi:cytochrome c-type biogenesis protein
MIALFGAGIASFLAPCVVPLLPAYLGIIVGEGAASGDTRKAVPATLIFVAGFATVFAAFGVVAGFVGHSIGNAEDWVDQAQIWIQRVGGVIIIAMGLALLGAFKRVFSREFRLIDRIPSGGGRARPFVVGVAFGAAWSPCVGPLLGAALTVALIQGEPVRGGLLLLSYALGIGVPFVLASLGLASSERAGEVLNKMAPRLERVAGVLLVALGVLLVSGFYADLTSYLARFTPTLSV